MKHLKLCFIASALLISMLISVPAWAFTTELWKFPETLSLEEAGFKMEVPYDISYKRIEVKVEPLAYEEITPVNDYFVVSAVESMVGNTGTMSKPVRLLFSFTHLDYYRASRLNMNLPVGSFRIGYWDNLEKNWVELPSRVYWNGSTGVVEAEEYIKSGQYALLWSYKPGATLSESNNKIRIMLNLITIKTDVDPYIKEGRTMVPVRFVAENLGARVEWVEAYQRVEIFKGVDSINLWVGNQKAEVNGKSVPLDMAPEIVNGRTFVPLRFIAESLGVKVYWDESIKTVKLSTFL
ncbi:copper amine oxidase N-terminal domain-containing protein [Pelotomaculum propionicicum]|uniref:copper amine oxidase N-terminal domain-containing protein n=1 Tax=Pelotomaculum propionicicum TaxID=258475 RepID=UPI003B8156C9